MHLLEIRLACYQPHAHWYEWTWQRGGILAFRVEQLRALGADAVDEWRCYGMTQGQRLACGLSWHPDDGARLVVSRWMRIVSWQSETYQLLCVHPCDALFEEHQMTIPSPQITSVEPCPNSILPPPPSLPSLYDILTEDWQPEVPAVQQSTAEQAEQATEVAQNVCCTPSEQGTVNKHRKKQAKKPRWLAELDTTLLRITPAASWRLP